MEAPGQRVIDAGTTPRQILMTTHDAMELPGPIWIDGTYSLDGANTGRVDELRAGCVMAQITASRKWVPCKRTRVTNSGTLTALVVDNASFFKVGETISVGADTGLVITAIDYATNTITIPSTAVVAGEAVVVTAFADSVSAAGAEIPRGILANSLRLLSSVPRDTTQRDQEGVILFKGYVNSSMILGDYAAARSATTNYLGSIQWSDQQQAV